MVDRSSAVQSFVRSVKSPQWIYLELQMFGAFTAENVGRECGPKVCVGGFVK